MKNKFGFSLAEALITLLIVSIIAVVSAPLITKKSRKIDSKTVWSINTDNYATITPTDGRDIKLGRTRSGKTQGIVIVDRLEFKNRDGRVIGWIDEDGSSSFSGVSNEMLQTELMNLVTNLSKDMQAMLSASRSQASTKTNLPTHKRHPINNAKQRHPITKQTEINNINSSINEEQLKEVEKLSNEIFKLLEMNNR